MLKLNNKTMKYPNFNEEEKLWRKGYKIVIGLDEAGRGPLAGPVIAAAVSVSPKLKIKNFNGVKDSKKLTAKQREYFYKILTTHSQIKWGVGRVSEKVIDRINILEATKLAMLKAIADLERKIKKIPKNFTKIEFLILDGNFKINSKIPQKSIIKADGKVFSCAAASIIAKVTRDRIMLNYHRKYPQYGFDRHKGYPTRAHIRNIEEYGICGIYRKTFNPISRYVGRY